MIAPAAPRGGDSREEIWMKAVLQRVSGASVRVEGETVGEIGIGLVILLCVEPDDGEKEAAFFGGKIAKLRIFRDEAGKMNRAVTDVGGSALAISQFTLSANWRKGNRPSFIGAAAPEKAMALYESFCGHLRAAGVPVETGVFAAEMEVAIVNDGPVTIWMDSADNG